MSTERTSSWKKGDPIGYIQEKAPDFEMPSYEGKRYEVLVPDTLNLQERASLAINCLTGMTDPYADYEIYWYVFLHGNRPCMSRDLNHQVQLIMQRALPLMRIISGSDQNMEVEQKWLEVLLRLQGPDGLFYYPLEGRPWISYKGSSEGQYDDFEGNQYTGPLNNGWSLAILGLYYELTGNKLFKEMGEKLVDGMIRHAVHREDYAFYPKGIYGLSEVSDPDTPIPSVLSKNLVMGWTTYGLAHFFRATGYEPALSLAGELTRFVWKHSNCYSADGVWLMPGGHYPWHCGCLFGILEYAAAVKDEELLEFVRKGYEYGKAPAQNGNVLIGFFPENAHFANQTGEICGVSFMLSMAVKLSLAGVGDYWDDIDRWVRNHFTESQLLSYEWMYNVVADQPKLPINEITTTDDRVGERNVGGFAGWPSPNDFFGNRQIQGGNAIYMHCCTGEGTMALYRVWEKILNYHDGKLKVNLLFNCASLWADVDSYIPYEGRVDVKVKKACELEVRIPEWVKPDECACTINNAGRLLSLDGRYAKVGGVKPDDIATLTFPIFERKDEVLIEGRKYTIVRKGNDMVKIDPPGKYCPLYQRAHYRENKARLRKIQRFVSQQLIDW